MLGTSLLNDIVRRNVVSNAGEVLDELRTHLKESLHQTDMKSSTKDGIDIGLLAIHKKTNVAFFAGANSKLLLFRKGELIEYKGDRMPVGVYKYERNFTNYSIQLQQGDNIYMFSDGYIDQFGGKYGRKYRINNFKKLLASIQNVGINKQQQVLENTLNNWQAEYQQIDDIVVLGVKI